MGETKEEGDLLLSLDREGMRREAVSQYSSPSLRLRLNGVHACPSLLSLQKASFPLLYSSFIPLVKHVVQVLKTH